MQLPKRKPNRLPDYDYDQAGAYFITICTKDRLNLLWLNTPLVGATCGRPQQLSLAGKIVHAEINKIPAIYENVAIDKYVIMPNHTHMIIMLQQSGRPKAAPTVPRIVKQFKGSISKQIGFSIWQKSYYDHIIRNEREYLTVWEYIDTNPIKWELDEYYRR